MAKKDKPLLNEGTVRRMMKLANMEALGNGFISEKYTPLSEEELDEKKYTAKKEKPGADKRKGAEKRGAEGTLAKTKGHGKVDYVKEELDEQEELTEEDELDIEAAEEVDIEAAPEGDDAEGEVTITDEEAQDIIDLADKLKDAVGGEEEAPEEVEMEMGAEEEIGLEEPGSRMYEEELYEAALKGLNIDLVDDKAEQRKAVVQETKKRIYERVVNRLLAEMKKK